MRPDTDAYSPFNRTDLTKKKVRIPCTIQAHTRKLIYDHLNKVHYHAEPEFFRLDATIVSLELDPKGKARICTLKFKGQKNYARLPVGAITFEGGVDYMPPKALMPYLDDAF